MAIFDVDVEGVTYEVKAPDEATAWKWAKATHLSEKKDAPKPSKPVPQTFIPSGEKSLNIGPELVASNPITRFALGAAEFPQGLAQLLAKNTGNLFGSGDAISANLKAVNDMKNRGMAATGDEGFDAYGMAGSMLNPAGLKIAGAIPNLATMPHKNVLVLRLPYRKSRVLTYNHRPL